MEELPKAYNPSDHEASIYKMWEDSGAFTPTTVSSQPSPARSAFSTADAGGAVSREDKISSGKRQTANGKPFVISMPPPNVTGKLHIGHALFITLQDILTRYHRMKGEPTLWLPGTDHAGIATQTVVDKALQKKGMSRRELGREKFVEEVWKWKEEYGGEITRQLRSMGASCDWSRERFTLDEGLTLAVKEAFVDFYRKGLIYRGEYIVNWCPKCATAISDDEVEHKSQTSKLYYFKYDKNFPIIIATTRPETKFGDTAVAVNPSDKRYAKFVGKQFEINLDGVKRKIKIISDRIVDKDFGTGAVGLTPAHSMTDWKMAESHDLGKIKIINERGRMNENAGKYAGLKVLEAREKLVEYLRQNNLIEKEEDFENNLSICYRCGGAIEPLPSLQWFVKMKPLAEKAKKAVEDGEIKIVPKRFEKVYFHWMDNIHDWCISRQLWWGHRIPVWYRQDAKLEVKRVKGKVWDLKIYGRDIFNGIKNGTKTIELRAGRPETDEKYWGKFKAGDQSEFRLADENNDQIIKDEKPIVKSIKKVTHFDNFEELFANYKAEDDYPGKSKKELVEWWTKRFKERIEKHGIWVFELENSEIENSSDSEIYVGTTPPRGEGWIQDEDVLDTWFSSGLWPFSTLGWPENQLKVKRVKGKVSDFEYFYPTTIMETGYDILFFWVARMIMMGLELTGRAPFKTVYLHGLVRDEQNRKMSKSLGNVLDPIDISDKFGTDAMRMALVVGTTAGNDIAVGESKIQGYRNFANKVWNIARFVITNLENSKGVIPGKDPESRSPMSERFASDSRMTNQDKKDLEEFEKLKETVTKALDNLEFSRAGEHLYGYVWHEFADKIIEESKKRLEKEGPDKEAAIAKLTVILIDSLKMLHPFIPFVTEAIWQSLPTGLKDEKLLISSKWPE